MKIIQNPISFSKDISQLMYELGYNISSNDIKKNLLNYNGKRGVAAVITEKQKAIGFISFCLTPLMHQIGCTGRITSLIVSKSHRRKGIASKLLSFVEKWGKQKNCCKFEVTSAYRRKDAHQFYESHGYGEYRKRFIKTI